MPTYSKAVKNLYTLMPVGYLLTILLPTMKSYEILLDGRSSLVSKIQLEELGSKEYFFLFSDMQEWGIFAMIFLLISIAFSGLAILRIRKDESPGRYTRISWLSALLAYYFIDSFRRYLIDEAYTHDVVFNNVAEYTFGYYVLWLTIALNLIIPRIKPDSSNDEIIDRVKEKSKNGVSSIFGPSFVLYTSIHMTALIFIFVSYGIWAGWGKMLDGPSYYTEMIFTFGLNRTVEDQIPWYITTFSWVLAPTLVVLMGTIFFFVKLSGFAPNGPSPAKTSPETVLLDEEFQYSQWAYFSKDVPNVGEYNFIFDNPKMNWFYLGIWGSILIGTIIGTLINIKLFKKEKQTRYFPLLRFLMVVGWAIGLVFASMSAPVFVTPSGIFQSVFIDRQNNNFVKYKWILADDADNGFYNPLSIFWMITIIWSIITAVIIGIGSLIRYAVAGEFLKKTERTDVKGKFVEDEISELPFSKVKIINK